MGTELTSAPRIGIPYRTRKEELTPNSDRLSRYAAAVRDAGGIPVEVSLDLPAAELREVARGLGGIVLSGSPADVEPGLYRAYREPKCNESDAAREKTDFALIEYALRDQTPLLAICYGIQSLNVVLGGTLIQDIPTTIGTGIEHDSEDDEDAFHMIRIEPGSRLAELAGGGEARVNSSHHQAILDPGRDLRVVARAPDGVVEAVEWTGGSSWLMGVQWHPERMFEYDALARALFRSLLNAAEYAVTRSPETAANRHSR